MPIKIDNFQLGVAQSPHTGFADMRNVLIDEKDGIATIGWKTVSVADTSNMVNWITQDENNLTTFYAIDISGIVYQSTNSGDSWAILSDRSGSGEGIKVWKDYVIVASNPSLEAYGPISGSATWNNLATFANGTNHHPMFKGQDDILYVGDARHILSIEEVGNFSAGTASTYTINTQALDLPEDYYIKSIDESGINLMIGTRKGISSLYESQIGDIFPWDRTTDSFELPIKLQRSGINQMISLNNLIYFNAGVEGEYFITNGSSVKLLKQIPKHIVNLVGQKWINSNPGAIMIFNNKLYFGIMSSSSSGEEITDGVGVWSINLNTGAIILENQISTGSTGGTTPNDVAIRAIAPVGKNRYLIGYTDGATYKIDKVSNTQRYTDYAARIDSQYYSVGTKNKPESFSQLEFELAEPLRTGEGIRFFYRIDLRSAFTSIRTFDFATDGAIQGGNTDFLITTEQGIQVRIEMTTGASSTTTISLKSVIII